MNPEETKAPEVIEPSILFVYGTLRSGFHNNHHLKTANCIGKGKTLGRMYIQAGTFLPTLAAHRHQDTYDYRKPNPIEIKDEYAVGEVYEIPAALWERLDRLESHPKWYERKLADIEMENGSKIKAWVYFMPLNHQNSMGGHIVKSGDYTDGVREEEARIADATKKWNETKDYRIAQAKAAGY